MYSVSNREAHNKSEFCLMIKHLPYKPNSDVGFWRQFSLVSTNSETGIKELSDLVVTETLNA